MALSADRTLAIRGVGVEIPMPAAAADIFYVGAIIVVTQGTYVGGEAATDAATKKFMGVNMTNQDNSAGVEGDLTLTLLTGPGVEVNFPAASAADTTWVGLPVYATDDEAVELTGTATASVEVGLCTEVISATEVRVMLNPFGAVGA